jgi:hypothetical protein
MTEGAPVSLVERGAIAAEGDRPIYRLAPIESLA